MIILVSQPVYDTKRNIFEKHPKIGVTILKQLLAGSISSYGAVEIFKENDISISRRTIDRHIKKIRENGGIQKPIRKTRKTTPNINTTAQQPKTEETNLIAANLKNELSRIEELDYSKIKEVDPIKILDKNMMKLELLLTGFSGSFYLKEQGAIIELEMKLAREIYKMRPTSTEFDLNQILRRNDWATEFILTRVPEKKEEFLSWMSQKQAQEQ